MVGGEESGRQSKGRVFSIAKDEAGFKIVVKPRVKSKATQSVQYIRGYLSYRFAEQDIERLADHLITKRIATFIKATGIECDMTPPSKKRRRDIDAISHVASGAGGIRGSCLKQLRRRLIFAYSRYKAQPDLNDGSKLSKKEWTRQQYTLLDGEQHERDISNLVQDVRTEAGLTYLYQRLQLLEIRRKSNGKLITGLRECIYTATCYKKLREFVSKEEKEDDIIDLINEGPIFTEKNTSKSQMMRVTLQCFVTYNTLLKLDNKAMLETSMLKSVLQEVLCERGKANGRDKIRNILVKHDADKKAFRSENSIEKISSEVRLESGGNLSAKTIRVWYHDYIDHESFQEDRRGAFTRVTFLQEYDYSLRFQIYLKNERKLTVDTAARELETIISKDPPQSEEGKRAFERLKPFSRRTVHRWMTKLGCKYEKATISYYTDTHEAEETKRDFKER